MCIHTCTHTCMHHTGQKWCFVFLKKNKSLNGALFVSSCWAYHCPFPRVSLVSMRPSDPEMSLFICLWGPQCFWLPCFISWKITYLFWASFPSSLKRIITKSSSSEVKIRYHPWKVLGQWPPSKLSKIEIWLMWPMPLILELRKQRISRPPWST